MKREDLNEVKKIIKRAGDDLEKLDKIQKSALSRIPAEHLPKVTGIMADYNHVLRSMKRGDTDAIQKIYTKYANSN